MLYIENGGQFSGQEIPKVASFESALKDTIGALEIPSSAFNTRVSDVVWTATELLEEHQMLPEFAHSYERLLFALAIGNEWHAASFPERIDLENVLKLAAVDESETYSYSIKVSELAGAGYDSGLYFDPESVNAGIVSWDKNRVSSVNEYADLNQDKIASLRLQQRLKYEKRLLQSVKDKLHIIEETEWPYEIQVLNKSCRQINEDIGGAAWCLLNPGKSTMILGRDFRLGHLQHEYAHTQSLDGVMSGYQGMLFTGLNEGITESKIASPYTYEFQRYLYRYITNNSKGKELVNKAYRDSSYKLDLYSYLVQKFGLRGYLAIARVGDNDSHGIDLENSIYLTPEKVLDRLFKN
ncbi:MAG: hypothetical protein ABIO02_00040 [Patescibacteria group bacterium]